MQRNHLKALDAHRPFFLKNLQLSDSFVTSLSSILPKETFYRIKATDDPHKGNAMLLDQLKRRGPHAFEAFTSALRASNQTFLANKISNLTELKSDVGSLNSGRAMIKNITTIGKHINDQKKNQSFIVQGLNKKTAAIVAQTLKEKSEVSKRNSIQEVSDVVEWRNGASKHRNHCINIR